MSSSLRDEQRDSLIASHYWWWQSRLTKPCFVYVIQGEPGTPLKIGRARDVVDRLRTLQTGNPEPLNVRLVLPGSSELEWQLHHKFREHRLSGEWFSPAVEVRLPWIAALAKAMVEAYDDSGRAPSHRQPGYTWPRYKGTGKNTITVTYVDPEPVAPETAAERLRAAWIKPRYERRAA